jgi:hypothetical protein
VIGKHHSASRPLKNAEYHLTARKPAYTARQSLAGLRHAVYAALLHFGLESAPHIVEAILNHVSGHKSGVAGIYNRATYEREVRSALLAWADHVRLIIEGVGRKVIPLRA